MASNINSTDIDAEYPVPGIDNDSQGFRDNFSTIKDSLAAARAEIIELQQKAIFKSALDSEALNNDLNYTEIKEATLVATTEKTNPTTLNETQGIINFTNGHYQTITMNGGDKTIILTEWPDQGVAKIRLKLLADDVERTVTWSATPAANFFFGPDWPASFTVTSSTNPTFVDFWTDDGGSTIFAQYLGEFSE